MHEFEPIAKKLWHGDGETIKLVETLTDHDRTQVGQRLLVLYGANVNLVGPP
jgi:hypothetical protein